jgi:hypothetical protein
MNPSPVSPPRVSTGPEYRPDKREVTRVAFELWQKQGCPAGRDELIWLEAARLVARGGRAGAAPIKSSGNPP